MAEYRRRRRSYLGRLWTLLTIGLRRLFRLEDTPRSIALGAALGIFVAMTPTYGFQIILILLLNTVLRVNRVAGVIMVYVTNPVTIIPVYWFDYKWGAQILGQESINREAFGQVFRGVSEAPFLEAVRRFLGLGWDILFPMAVGGVMLGALCAAVSYPFLFLGVQRVKEKRALRRARRKLRRMEQGELPFPEIRTIPARGGVNGGNGSQRRLAAREEGEESPS